MMNKILVVCIGNICRSPMAEALLAARLIGKNPEIVISSAGIHAMTGWEADPFAQTLMKEKGLDISMHRARQATREIVFDADLILTMNAEQTRQIELLIPGTRGRIFSIGKWGEFEVPDPWRKPRTAFEESLRFIEQGVDDWCQKLWN